MTSLPLNWRLLAIQEIADVVGGGTPKTSIRKYWNGGIPWITPKDLSSHTGRYIGEGSRDISEEGLHSSGARLIPPGSILVSSRAPIGYVAIADRHLSTNQGFRSLVLREGHVSEYFYYLLKCSTSLLISRANGSTFKEISGSAMKQIVLPVPPTIEQHRIATILGALDDRIELNQRMNGTLEAIAQTLFRARFLTFEGRDDLIDSGTDLGRVPEGWRVASIGSVVNAVGGSTPSTSQPAYWEGGTYHWTTPKDLSALSSPVLLDTERKITREGLSTISSGLLPTGTVLMSSRAPVGYLAISEVPIAVNQGYIAIPPSEAMSNLFILFWLQANMERIKARAGGTTFQEISKRNFRPILMAVPPTEDIASFDSVVRPLYDQIVLNEQQSRTLASLRDTLLPKLISGKLRVPEAENLAETAL